MPGEQLARIVENGREPLSDVSPGDVAAPCCGLDQVVSCQSLTSPRERSFPVSLLALIFGGIDLVFSALGSQATAC